MERAIKPQELVNAILPLQGLLAACAIPITIPQIAPLIATQQ
jgi:hypothetical protein